MTVVLLSASCSTGSEPSDEDLEDYSEGSLEEYDAEGFAGQTFDFSMTADLGQLADAVHDSMETVWTGTFTIDEDGILQGTGSAFLNAAIFSDVDGCGYVWYENADFEFTISGEAQQREGTIKLLLVVDLASDPIPVRTEPTATCEDPGTWQLDTPEIYFDLHRDNMLSTIQLGLQRIGPSILIGQTREAETGGVDYNILVILAAVPLTE
jgi:hypothetical protein